MIADIRAYFNTQITMVDPALEAWDSDLFGNNNLNRPQAERYYNLVIGSNNPTRDGNGHSDQINIILDIYTSECADLMTAFDALYDKGLDIKNCIIDTRNYDGIFNDIEFTLIEPIEESNNDNAIKVRLEFIIRRNFTF